PWSPHRAVRAACRSSSSRTPEDPVVRPECAALCMPSFARSVPPLREVPPRRSRNVSFHVSTKREREQRVARGNRDVLLAVHRVTHRTRVHLTTERRLPQQCTRARIQCKEIAFLAAAEHDVTGGRQYTAPGDVGHFVFPLRLERVRIVS